MNKTGKRITRKLFGIVLTLTLLVGALYVPLSLSASAAVIPVTEDSEVVFTFSESEGSVKAQGAENNLTRGDDGIGCASWGMSILAGDNNPAIGFKYENPVDWSTPGGYRLNNNDGVYNVEPSSTYIVSFKLQVRSAPCTTASITRPATSYLDFGYGMVGGTTNNTVSGMKTVVSRVYSADTVPQTDKAKATFKLTTDAGVKDLVVGDTWHELTYVFSTPADLGEGKPSLGFYANNYYGTDFLVDDVSVTKIASTKGVVVLIDEYYGTTDVLIGAVGEEAELPTLTGKEADHEFLGWYKDADRTVVAENITFAKEKQTLYTKWKAPVTVTFVDGFNGKNYEVTGIAGEKINYPADPVDEINEPDQSWFMGWYTTESYTEEFTATTFGYSNYSVYAKWLSAIEDKVIDFENYKSNDGNTLRYGAMMSIVTDPTGENNTKVNKYNWDVNATAYNPDRYGALDSCVVMEKIILTENTIYTVTFDYYVEDIAEGTTFTIFPLNSNNGNIWQGTRVDFKSTQGAMLTATAADKGEWRQGSFTFTMKYGQPDNTALYFVMTLSDKSNATVYIDNIVFKSTQPYEASVTYVHGDGQANKVVMGKRGEAIPEYVPVGNATFMGWYLDEALTIPFEEKVFSRLPITLYAKWSGKVIEFDRYVPTNDLSFTKSSLSIDKTTGIGYSDDAALRFDYLGSRIYPGADKPFYERNGAQDYCASLMQLENNKTYNITYYVNVEQANKDFRIIFGLGHDGNIWQACAVDNNTSETYYTTDAGKGWIKKTVIMTTDFPRDDADDLYIFFLVNGAEESTVVKALIDRIEVVESGDDIVIFNTGKVGDKLIYQFGKQGDAINFPQLTNGGVTFTGWYTDADCTVKFTDTVMAKGTTKLYAGWKGVAHTFENFPYTSTSTMQQGKLVNVVNGSGVGIDDNYKLHFKAEADAVMSYNAETGITTYWASRMQVGRDHCIRLGELKNHTAYKITYYYKSGSAANVDTQITFATAHDGNIWDPAGYKNYSITKQIVAVKEKQWKKAETIIYTDFPGPLGVMLFMQFAATGNAKGAIAEVDIDNMLIEPLDKPYIYYDGQNDNYGELVLGAVGGAITEPIAKPIRVGYSFTGWFLDKEGTIPFEQKVFNQNDSIIVYASYVKASYVLYDFENFKFTNSPGWYLWDNGNSCGAYGVAHSGVNALRFDRNPDITNGRFEAICIGDGTEIFKLDTTRQYVVTFKYYIKKAGSADALVSFRAGHDHNHYHNCVSVSDKYRINIMQEKGKWHTGALVLDPSECKEGSEFLYLLVDGGQDFELYFDDVAITTLPAGHVGYVVDNGGCSKVPMYVTGPIGSSFASKLPKNPEYENHIFKGYKVSDANGNVEDLKTEDMKFTKDRVRISANFVRLKTTQDFEGGYKSLIESYADYIVLDYDYWLYDAEADGADKSNVTSGRYSLHRKGTSMYFENAQVLTQDLMLSAAERYTVTMKVKLGKHFQTDGAIKIASCRSHEYAWTTIGDYYAILAVSDLADGEWHEVSYTFNAVAPYVAIQTPGYCELFIDDIVFTRVDTDTPLSKSVDFVEYVPAKRDANGNLVEKDTTIDVSTIVDDSLYNTSVNWLLFVIIGAAVLVAVGAVVVVLLVLKKKKNKV